MDSHGNIFVFENIPQPGGTVLELPWTGTGYGPQITLPFSGLAWPRGIAVDSAGNVLIADQINQDVDRLWAASHPAVHRFESSLGSRR